mmetsp:Transcript_39114/g.63056  ORF Transcript_39114/g.63056 Transcript_39114/m.63056 type:complete len:80 (+) Transcript_39114:55-294(+)
MGVFCGTTWGSALVPSSYTQRTTLVSSLQHHFCRALAAKLYVPKGNRSEIQKLPLDMTEGSPPFDLRNAMSLSLSLAHG